MHAGIIKAFSAVEQVPSDAVLPGMAGVSKDHVGPPRTRTVRIFGIENEMNGIPYNQAQKALRDAGLPVGSETGASAKHSTAFLATEDGSLDSYSDPEIKFPPMSGEDGFKLMHAAMNALSGAGNGPATPRTTATGAAPSVLHLYRQR